MNRLLLALVLAGCASGPGPRQIAGDLDMSLRLLADWPLSVRCRHVRDAMDRCERAGLPRDCAWDGWHDADHDGWTVSICKKRIAEEGP